jgi:hypothetical protein
VPKKEKNMIKSTGSCLRSFNGLARGWRFPLFSGSKLGSGPAKESLRSEKIKNNHFNSQPESWLIPDHGKMSPAAGYEILK